jgi:hypothetical protein
MAIRRIRVGNPRRLMWHHLINTMPKYPIMKSAASKYQLHLCFEWMKLFVVNYAKMVL